ncbi:MAG: DUF1292 domain-containing protein [Oscillospiraceae bacterium]|nr:DUF1292 domain-containing protein [Oscillospiraceae bacterium]MBQ8788601.1 DUF1292 domain-containing protein [Oscillospiraceae bacterium]MBR2639947.1 DUF1292 domain-containing protein [Oscillospiraceae bacterium]
MSKQNNNLPETEDYGNDYVTLVDENGKETEFEIVDSLVTENNEYFALIPTETAENIDSDDGELVILKVVEEDGQEFLEPIEDDEEYEEISEIFIDRLEELYEFENEQES